MHAFHRPFATALLFFAVLSTGCASDGGDSGGRGPLGKADAVGSCTERSCGEQALDGNCWCDDQCEENGDCCDNYQALCAERVTCFDRDDCPADQYCAFAPNEVCGFIELPGGVLGSCQTPPQACPRIHSPVCGCDSMTYSNDCVAAMAGTNVFSKGPCDSADSCEIGSATGVGTCTLLWGFRWAGTSCLPVLGCSCEGPDCDKLHATHKECDAAHAACF